MKLPHNTQNIFIAVCFLKVFCIYVLLYRILSVCQGVLESFLFFQKGIFMTLYERIEDLRKSREISQADLEKELGFSNGSISKWKKSSPTPERLLKFAQYFDVSMEYLMTGEERKVNSIASSFPLSDLEKEVIRKIRQLNDSQKDLIFSMLNIEQKGDSNIKMAR